MPIQEIQWDYIPRIRIGILIVKYTARSILLDSSEVEDEWGFTTLTMLFSCFVPKKNLRSYLVTNFRATWPDLNMCRQSATSGHVCALLDIGLKGSPILPTSLVSQPFSSTLYQQWVYNTDWVLNPDCIYSEIQYEWELKNNTILISRVQSQRVLVFFISRFTAEHE